MFSKDEFLNYLDDAGFKILYCKEFHPMKLIKFFTLNAIKK